MGVSRLSRTSLTFSVLRFLFVIFFRKYLDQSIGEALFLTAETTSYLGRLICGKYITWTFNLGSTRHKKKSVVGPTGKWRATTNTVIDGRDSALLKGRHRFTDRETTNYMVDNTHMGLSTGTRHEYWASTQLTAVAQRELSVGPARTQRESMRERGVD